MDQATTEYIYLYYRNLLPSPETLAVDITERIYLHGLNINAHERLTRIYRDHGWISDQQSVLDLVEGGFDQFKEKVATVILTRYPNKVVLNTCPSCGGIARTPAAKQCRYCGHSWRD